MKKIAFYFGIGQKDDDGNVVRAYPGVGSPYRLGEMISSINACYFRGKELGYDDITLEWPLIKYNIANRRKYSILKPKDGLLPIKFEYFQYLNHIEYDEIINLNKPNSLYEGCESYSVHYKYKNIYIFPTFLIKYYLSTGIAPFINLKKKKNNKFLVIFHYRNSYYSQQRNSNLDDYHLILNKLKDVYGDDMRYEITGDCYKSSKDISNGFDDIHFPYIRNINKFFKLMSSADLMIGPPSISTDSSRMFGIPLIDLYHIKEEVTKGYDTTKYQKQLKDKYGKQHMFWDDPERYYTHIKDTPLDMNPIMDFVDKHYKAYIHG